MSENGFCQMYDYQDYPPLIAAGHYAGPLSESNCSSGELKPHKHHSSNMKENFTSFISQNNILRNI